jgi:proteasome lid subunit RPN8/RPN11
MNLARSGFGRWTLIDPDILMPHNLARHALDGRFVGFNKAETVAYAASSTSFEEDVFKGLDGDLLRPGAQSEAIQAALSSADVIADMTASVAAQRHLARDVASPARRLCAFLTPSGADLVVLAEDAARDFALDALEMQYYRALLHDGELAGHLELPSGRQRYARSCGDTTSAMPQDFVALHAAIASRTLKEILAEGEPFIAVWRADASCSVRRVPIEVQSVTEFELNPWTVVLDNGLRERLIQHRKDKLPSETGGVLLGSFDLEREILYIVDTLPSPPDSKEKTDLYIRGCRGLRDAVADVEAKTGGMLEYVGEWHSHPRGASTRPSGYDLAAFGWLTALMSKDGLPAVMMIVGDAGEVSLFIGSMSREASPIPEGSRGDVVA